MNTADEKGSLIRLLPQPGGGSLDVSDMAQYLSLYRRFFEGEAEGAPAPTPFTGNAAPLYMTRHRRL